MGSAKRGTAIAPLSTIGTRYGNSVSTASMPQNQRETSASSDSPLQRVKEKSRYGISVSTPHRRYGRRLRTPFLRTPFPRLLLLGGRFGYFLFFLLLGEGEGGVRGIGGGTVFCCNSQEGGVRPGGAEGLGGCLRRIGEIFGGGEAKYFFFGAEMSTKIKWATWHLGTQSGT